MHAIIIILIDVLHLMKAYPVKSYPNPTITLLNKVLTDCRIVLITTAGLYLKEQKPYKERIIGGNCSYREIPNTIDIQSLLHGHKSIVYDARGTKTDVNLVFPLDRFRELEIAAELTIMIIQFRQS